MINLVEISSREVARKNKNKEVSIWHLLISILTVPRRSGIKFIDIKILKNIKQEAMSEIEKLEKILVNKNEIFIPKINKEIFSLINEAQKEFKFKTVISTKEIFYQILKSKKLLKKYKLSKSCFRFKDQNILEYLNNKIRLIETYKEFEEEIRFENEYFEIEKYVKNLTSLAKNKELDPLIGRDKEITALINILLRRNKKSAILLGEPGVGKTAIVEGLAARIVQRKVNIKLQNKVILMLQVSSLVSGTKYRGEFEERLNGIIQFINKKQNVIIFIDEIHTLIGAGSSSEGTLDASNMLKPFLSRAEIQIIGATTLNEYRKYILNDKAFARRFQTILVQEPDEKDTLAIIGNIIKIFEDYHEITYEKGAIENAVKLSSKYLINKRFPDKAIDLIDISGASKKLEASNESKVTSQDVQKAINEMLSITVKNCITKEIEILKEKQKIINQKIIGQEDAVSQIVKEFIKIQLEINEDRKPLTSILLIGSNGCGKTMIADELSKNFMKDKNSILKLDMADYRGENSISRLIGTNPGYIGYSDGGLLTNKLKYSSGIFVLFENIENAHNSILNLISQVLENGELIDSKEDKISFHNAIIVMTTSIGSKVLVSGNSIGFKKHLSTDGMHNMHSFNNEIDQELKRQFKSSVLSKIQKKIVLNVLTNKDVEKICKNFLSNLEEKLCSKGIRIQIEKGIEKFIVEKYYDKNSGARSVINAIKAKIEDNVISKLIEGQDLSNITVYLENNEIKIK